MNFINHSRTGIKIYTFSDYRRDFAWKETPRINDGATLGQHQAQHAVELQVLINRHGAEGTLNSLRYLLWDSRYGDK